MSATTEQNIEYVMKRARHFGVPMDERKLRRMVYGPWWKRLLDAATRACRRATAALRAVDAAAENPPR